MLETGQCLVLSNFRSFDEKICGLNDNSLLGLSRWLVE